MSEKASEITGVSIVYWTVCSGADQRKHQSSASLAFNSPQKGTVTLKMFPFDDVIMTSIFTGVIPECIDCAMFLSQQPPSSPVQT